MFTNLNFKIIQSSLRFNQTILSYSSKWRPKLPKVQTEIDKFVNTEQWRNAIEIINRENVACTRFNLPVFDSLAERAFYDNDKELAWQLLNKISKSGFEPSSQLFKSYWTFCTQNRNQFHATVEEMLKFVADNRILVTASVLNDLDKSIEPFGGIAYKTRVDYDSGLCEQCSSRVIPEKLSILERGELERQFKNAIIRPMVKQNQYNCLKQHVNSKKKFRYIIDALNVTRIGPNNKGNTVKQGNLLIKLIDKLNENWMAASGNILIIGKKHIKTWPEHVVLYMQRNATVFLTNDEKDDADDILMMYAAILSGEKACFITNDRLSEYPKYFDEKTQDVFRRWQNQHQLLISYDEREENVKLNRISQHRAIKDIKSNHWHIPYIDRRGSNSEIHSNLKWACVQFKINKEN